MTDTSRQLVIGLAGCCGIEGDADPWRFEQDQHLLALIESQLLSALRGDGDVQAGFSVSQQYFHVLLHLLAIAAGNGAEPLVAGAGLQGKARDGRQQAIQRQGIVIAEYIKRFLLDLRSRSYS